MVADIKGYGKHRILDLELKTSLTLCRPLCLLTGETRLAFALISGSFYQHNLMHTEFISGHRGNLHPWACIDPQLG